MPKTASEVDGINYAVLKKHWPMFSKRHFEAIAIVMADVYADCDEQDDFYIFNLAVDRLTKLFLSDNPSFNAGRFRIACEWWGVSGDLAESNSR